MSVNLIQAIGALWPLALIALLASAMILFREQIRAWMNEASHFSLKRGDMEFALKRGEKGEATPAKPAETGPPIEPSSPAADLDPVKDEAEPDLPSVRYLQVVSNKDRKSLDAAFGEVQAAETNEATKLTNESMHQYILFSDFGDGEALGKLRSLAARGEADAMTVRWLAYAQAKGGDHEQAAESCERAAKLCGLKEDRAIYLAEVANFLYLSGRKEAAFCRLMTELGKANSKDVESRLYEGLATLYEKAGEPFLRALALEKALVGRPNDRTLRFRAAFLYSEEAFPKLALRHYLKQIEFHSDDPSSLNNIGVEYGRLKMAGRSVRHYKKAIDRGETLAMTNLATLYINTGFLSEAAQVLDKARAMANLHPKVGRTLAHLSEVEESERETEGKYLEAAGEQQAFLTKFAEAALVLPKKEAVGTTFTGRWKLPDGSEFDVSEAAGRIASNWEISGASHYMKASKPSADFSDFRWEGR